MGVERGLRHWISSDPFPYRHPWRVLGTLTGSSERIQKGREHSLLGARARGGVYRGGIVDVDLELVVLECFDCELHGWAAEW